MNNRKRTNARNSAKLGAMLARERQRVSDSGLPIRVQLHVDTQRLKDLAA
jgi:hypothetical protein